MQYQEHQNGDNLLFLYKSRFYCSYDRKCQALLEQGRLQTTTNFASLRPAIGHHGVRLLHNNASLPKAAIERD